MRSLFKLHFHYLFSWKVIYVSLALLLLSILSSLLFSKFYLDYDLLVFNSRYYLEEYYFEGINYLKIIIVLFNMFLVINSFVLNKYDIFLIVRRSKKVVISSKIIILLLGSSVLIILEYLLFIITGLFLTPYMRISIMDLSILLDLIIFGGVYLLIFIIIYLYSDVIYSLLLGVVGFFISDLSMDYNIQRSGASLMAKALNLVFINIGYYFGVGYSLFYGKIYGIFLLEIMFIVISLKYFKRDF